MRSGCRSGGCEGKRFGAVRVVPGPSAAPIRGAITCGPWPPSPRRCRRSRPGREDPAYDPGGKSARSVVGSFSKQGGRREGAGSSARDRRPRHRGGRPVGDAAVARAAGTRRPCRRGPGAGARARLPCGVAECGRCRLDAVGPSTAGGARARRRQHGRRGCRIPLNRGAFAGSISSGSGDGGFMKRNAFAGAVGLCAFALAACSITIGSTGSTGSTGSAGSPGSSAPASPAVAPSSAASPSSPTAYGATYLALVAPANTAIFALDTAVLGPTADLTPQSLHSMVAASATSIRTLDDHLRSAEWPRTAVPDITTLASTNDVLIEVLEGYESELQAPSVADFNAVVQALRAAGSGYATDRGRASDAAARVRSDLGLPPPSAPQVTLND